MRQRNRHHSEDFFDESVGWISMTDLYTVIAVVAVALGIANAQELRSIIAAAEGDWQKFFSRANAAQAELKALRSDIEELQANVAKTSDGQKGREQAMQKEINDLNAQIANGSAQGDLKQALGRASQLAISANQEIANAKSDVVEATRKANSLQKDKEVAVDLSKKLAKDSDDLRAQISKLDKQVRIQSARLNALSNAKSDGDAKLREFQDQLGAHNDENAKISQELLGLKGSLDNVVFVLDCSSTMGESAERWSSAIKVVENWILHLPVKKVVLITFSSDVKRFPASGWVDLTGQNSRSDFLVTLRATGTTGGTTNTLGALEEAWRDQAADAIVLFTDGRPDSWSATGSSSGVSLVETIYAQAAQHRQRIHTVGVGDYFKAEASQFLLRLANQTGGTFIGR